MYTFKENISAEQFADFITKTSFAPIQQTESWKDLKSNWKGFYCGIFKNNEIVGAALILIRHLMPGFSYAYCPRGPVMDFTDKEAVKTFKEGATAFCRKEGAYSITVDPLLPVNITLPEIKEDAYFNPYDTEKGKAGFDNLVSSGFIHQGFGKELHDTLQPRFNAMIPLCRADGTPLTEAELKKNYRSKLKKYFGIFRSARGMYYEIAEPDSKNITLFKKIISCTEERQNISLRGEDYFALLSKSFGENATFGFEKSDVVKYIEGLEARLPKEPDMADKINEQLKEAHDSIERNGNIAVLSAILTVYPPNKEGIKVAEYLYAGSDLTEFPSFNATVCGLYEQCLLCISKGMHLLNLGGLAGTFDDGLYKFKNQFNPLIVEFAGEFDLPVNKFKYSLMKKYLPVLQKTYKKLIKLLKH